MTGALRTPGEARILQFITKGVLNSVLFEISNIHTALQRCVFFSQNHTTKNNVHMCFVCIVFSSKQVLRAKKQLLHWKHSVEIRHYRAIITMIVYVTYLDTGPVQCENHVES